MAVVLGGSDADVAQAIAVTKAPGTPTAGSQVVQVTLPNGNQIKTIRFERVKPVALTIDMRIRTQASFPPNGLVLIKEYLVQWFQGVWQPIDTENVYNVFDLSGIDIGESLDIERLQTPILSVPFYRLSPPIIMKKLFSATGYSYQTAGDDTPGAGEIAPDTSTSNRYRVNLKTGDTTTEFVNGISIGDTVVFEKDTSNYLTGEVSGISVDGDYVVIDFNAALVATGVVANDDTVSVKRAEVRIFRNNQPNLNQRYTLAEADINITIVT